MMCCVSTEQCHCMKENLVMLIPNIVLDQLCSAQISYNRKTHYRKHDPAWFPQQQVTRAGINISGMHASSFHDGVQLPQHGSMSQPFTSRTLPFSVPATAGDAALFGLGFRGNQ